jgi:hypothetical protein
VRAVHAGLGAAESEAHFLDQLLVHRHVEAIHSAEETPVPKSAASGKPAFLPRFNACIGGGTALSLPATELNARQNGFRQQRLFPQTAVQQYELQLAQQQCCQQAVIPALATVVRGQQQQLRQRKQLSAVPVKNDVNGER